MQRTKWNQNVGTQMELKFNQLSSISPKSWVNWVFLADVFHSKAKAFSGYHLVLPEVLRSFLVRIHVALCFWQRMLKENESCELVLEFFEIVAFSLDITNAWNYKLWIHAQCFLDERWMIVCFLCNIDLTPWSHPSWSTFPSITS